ncbi:MAG: hypothetical protein SOW66_00470 [Porphyromonas sp.]|nr:hypothetical protein [Porphyromonas sp.]
MKTLLREWNHIFQAPSSEEVTLRRLDGYNKTRYSRRKNKDGLLELASREAHDKQNTYYATILNDDDSPYCAIASNAGFWGVDFLRDNFDDYLIYDYRDSISEDGRLFLLCISLAECKPGTAEKIRRIDFRFLPDGSSTSKVYQGEAYDGTYEEIVEELPSLSGEELSRLWLDYPEFAKYDELIRLDRIPEIVRQRIFEYTDQEYPAFREHLARDLAKYQGIE